MVRYFIKRILLMIPMLFAIMFIAFLLTSSLAGTNMHEFWAFSRGLVDKDGLDLFFEKIGAETNVITKFIRYCYDIITKFEFGPRSSLSSPDIGEEVLQRLQKTSLVAVLGFIFAAVTGVPAGLAAAVKRNKWQDQTISSATLVLASFPSYCLAFFLMIIFCIYLRWLPVIGIGTWKGYILPTVVIGSGGMALTTRMTRSAVIEILSQPYITTLRAKGISEKRVLYVHVLKNALVPIISVLNNTAVAIVCSTLVVENFFTLPGVGNYLLTAVSARDQHKVLGAVFFLAIVIMLINLITDVCYVIADPQMRAGYRGKKSLRRRGKGGAQK